MKKAIKTIFFSFLMLWSMGGLLAQTQATVTVMESAGGCALLTDCENLVLCVDIVLTVTESKVLDSYNIWVEYDGDVISREAFGVNDASPVGDNSCVIANGVADTDLELPEANPDYWRVSGVPGSGFPLTADVPATIHTICFIIIQPMVLDGESICVGGNVGGLLTTITFTDATSDTDVPSSCMILDENFTSCSILPVGLLSFEARKSGQTTLLDWSTASEFNSDYFEIQRAGENHKFSVIGKIKSAGYSSEVLTYQYKDYHPSSGINYYRLRQVDFDGQYAYSAIRSVRFDGTGKLVGVWPNPVRDELNIEMEPRDGVPYHARLEGLNGTEYRNQIVEGGPYRMDLSGCPSGLYRLVISQDGEEWYEKIVIMD